MHLSSSAESFTARLPWLLPNPACPRLAAPRLSCCLARRPTRYGMKMPASSCRPFLEGKANPARASAILQIPQPPAKAFHKLLLLPSLLSPLFPSIPRPGPAKPLRHAPGHTPLTKPREAGSSLSGHQAAALLAVALLRDLLQIAVPLPVPVGRVGPPGLQAAAGLEAKMAFVCVRSP